VELAEIRIFYTEAKYVEQEKPNLNAAVGFKPAHDKSRSPNRKDWRNAKLREDASYEL
jgi:hypothetical protein